MIKPPTTTHPTGELSSTEKDYGIINDPISVNTFGGIVHVEWDPQEPVTPLGQLPFFIEFLKLSGLFEKWVDECPLEFTSNNAPSKRDVLGTLLLSILSGHKRYAHATTIRADQVNPQLLGMKKVVSEDSLRRALLALKEEESVTWLQNQLNYCYEQLLNEPWILDVDVTVKPLYGKQEGAVVGYNPKKPGRPSHTYHTYWLIYVLFLKRKFKQVMNLLLLTLPLICGLLLINSRFISDQNLFEAIMPLERTAL